MGLKGFFFLTEDSMLNTLMLNNKFVTIIVYFIIWLFKIINCLEIIFYLNKTALVSTRIVVSVYMNGGCAPVSYTHLDVYKRQV